MRVVCWECPDCGHQAHVVWKDTPMGCYDCGAEMERFGIIGCVTSVAESDSPTQADK